MGLFEELGRKADRAEFLQEQYDRLYQLVCDLATGAKFAKDIAVNPMDKSWIWTPPIPKERSNNLPPEVLEALKSRNGFVEAKENLE